MRFIMNGILMLVVLGFLVAVLQAFDWDFIAVIEWVFGMAWSVIDRISEFFSSNPTFREMTSAP